MDTDPTWVLEAEGHTEFPQKGAIGKGSVPSPACGSGAQPSTLPTHHALIQRHVPGPGTRSTPQ